MRIVPYNLNPLIIIVLINFREVIHDISDLEKFRLFLELENVDPENIPALTGVANPTAGKQKKEAQTSDKNFIPHIKEKIIWS